MSLDQILMIPGYSADGASSATFSLAAANLTAGTPVLGTPALTVNSDPTFPDPASYYNPTLTSSTYHAEYSIVRPLRAGITEVMLCRRASDDAELAFGGLYDPDEVSALETWSQGGDVFVKTIYDHSGNSAHLTQATNALQGKIVDSGSVIYQDEHPYGVAKIPAIDMSAASDALRYAGTAASAISNCDVSVMTLFRHAESLNGASSSRVNGLIIGAENKFFMQYDPNQMIVSVNNSPYLTLADRDNTKALTPLNYMTSLHFTTFGSADSTVYRNNTIVCRHTHSETPDTTQTALQFGSSTPGTYYNGGKLSEMIITTALDDIDRAALYAKVNGFYQVGPTTSHTVPGYQMEPWQETINDWLQTITEGDVTITPAAVSWDGTYATNDFLSNLWLTSDIIDDDWSLTADSKYWVADDGGGAGFLPDHVNHYYVWRTTNDSNGVSCARLAMFYELDLPLSGGGQGNPFKDDSGLGMRALVQAAAALSGHCREQLTSPTYASSPDIGGGSVAGAMFAFYKLKGLLTDSVRTAFYQAGLHFARKFEYLGARHDNANMDVKSIPFLVIVWKEATAKGDTEGAALCLRAAKQVLFGSTTGTPATSEWDIGDNPKAGVYATAGHFPENGTPETTYNGLSTKEAALALGLADGATEWDFLGTCLDSYNDFQELQSFDDYTTISGDSFQGPSGYASRTSGITWRGAGSAEWKSAIMAERDSTARWIARHHMSLVSTSSMVTAIQTKITNLADEAAATVPDFTGSAACHTNGYDWTGHTFTVDTATNELVIIGTHALQVNDPIVPHNVFGTEATSSAGAFAATQFWYVVGVSGQRISVSNTLGGGAVTFSDGGFYTDYSPHRLVPIYYLTNTPDLSSYPASGASVRHWLEAGSESGIILELDNTADMVAALTPGTAVASGSPVDYQIVSGPQEVGAGMHWPVLPVPSPPSGWYDTLKNLVDTNDPSTFTRTETIGQTYNISLGDEWWAYRNNDGTLDYAWFVSANTYGGANDGHHGNNLEAFWVEGYGVVTLTRRFDPGAGEGVFSNVANWITGHVWGKDDKGTPTAFSSQRGDQPDSTNSFSLGGSPPTVTTTRIIGAGGAGGTDGMQDGDEISGVMTVLNTFKVNTAGDGINVTVSVSSDQSDSVTELWHTIPIYLRDALQSGISDASIQYWNGSTWVTLGTSLVSADWIRLTRNHGSGDKYVFIHFTATQEIKLNAAVREQVYQESARSRLIHINLHSTTPGSTALLPSVGSPAVVSYDIQTTDPGLTPTDPSLSFTEPAAATAYFVGGFWWAKGTCDFYGTGGSVDFEYSTDSTDGTDGTWTTVATMTNTSSNIYEYAGEDIAIPSGLTYIRMNATDSAGSSTLARAVSSVAKTLVLDDSFVGANGTVIDGTWSGWSTNTTGNVYVQTAGSLEIDTNSLKTSSQSLDQGIIQIDVGSSDVIVEIEGTTNTTAGTRPYLAANAWVKSATNMLRFAIRNATEGFEMYENTTEEGAIAHSISTSSTYRVTMQVIGDVAVCKAYDVTGASTIGYLAVYGLGSTPDNSVGCASHHASYRLHSFKVWT